MQHASSVSRSLHAAWNIFLFLSRHAAWSISYSLSAWDMDHLFEEELAEEERVLEDQLFPGVEVP